MFSLHQSLTSEPTGLTLRNLPGVGDPERLSSGIRRACRGQFDRPLAQTQRHFEAAAALQSD
jgi:hypothetical protein